MGKLGVLVGFAVLALGCSSSDGGSPAEKCDDLLTAYCGHAADCVVQLGCDPGYTRDQENQACLTAAGQTVTCGNAKQVGSSYADCLNEASTTACAAFGNASQCTPATLPTDCQGVILF